MFASKACFIVTGPWSFRFKNVCAAVSHLPCTNGTFICLKQNRFIYQKANNDKPKLQGDSFDRTQKMLTPQVKDRLRDLAKPEAVKELAKDISYLGVIIVGVAVTGFMFYAFLQELLSGRSPNSVYSDALKICRSEPEVIDALGKPVKGYGEESSRGRRRNVSHYKYYKDQLEHMRIRFYVEGPRNKGTVMLEVRETKDKKFEYIYLIVDLEGYPRRTIVLKDNRDEE